MWLYCQKALGIKDLFKKNEADFTKLIGIEDKNCPPVFVNKMKQASNATVDEEGCYVASFTETEVLMGAAGFKKIFSLSLYCQKALPTGHKNTLPTSG